ncbi:hypothetical protein BD311DRAFT_789738 [Dichomitus squalens]|uniref:Uncharacterized protein n=1 Tax=Dichomitus squalens TaxID=114155 RepID=A0A4V2JZU8_9APHY|nr:hypothetical protein BD311DRAFT_789738 [Dichomitus squalens]
MTHNSTLRPRALTGPMSRPPPTRTHSKRMREQSPTDETADVVTSASASGNDNALASTSSNKRLHRVAAVKAEAKVEVKEEVKEEDIHSFLPPLSVPSLSVKADSVADHGALEASVRQSRKEANKPDLATGPSSPMGRAMVVNEPSRRSSPSNDSPQTAPQALPKRTRDEAASKGQSKEEREERWKNATAYYRFNSYEIDTLPHATFDNPHNPKSFGRLYNISDLRTLVSRKFAYLAGLDARFDREEQEVGFIKEGWKLFEAYEKRLEEAMQKKGRRRKPLHCRTIIEVVPIPDSPIQHHHGSMIPRPPGSWLTRVYQDGKFIGDHLNFQFDPKQDISRKVGLLLLPDILW